MHIYTHAHAYVCTDTPKYIYVHICTNKHTGTQYTHAHIHMCAHIYVYTYISAYTHICTHIYAPTCGYGLLIDLEQRPS